MSRFGREPKVTQPKRRTKAGRVVLASLVGGASVVVLPSLTTPAAANHRIRRCTEATSVAGSSLLRLGSLSIGTVRHFRSERCQANRAQFVMSPAFEQWARHAGFSWFASTMIFTRGQPIAGHPFAFDPFQGYGFGYNPVELWSSSVFDDGGRCSSAVANIILVRGNQYFPINQAVTSVVCN